MGCLNYIISKLLHMQLVSIERDVSTSVTASMSVWLGLVVDPELQPTRCCKCLSLRGRPEHKAKSFHGDLWSILLCNRGRVQGDRSRSRERASNVPALNSFHPFFDFHFWHVLNVPSNQPDWAGNMDVK